MNITPQSTNLPIFLEIGLPTTFAELGIPEDTDLRAVADSTVVTPGCCKKLTHDEIYDILQECR